MGAEQAKTRSRKGVVYSKGNNQIVDCLFCRIVRGESPPNQLWYRDNQCAIFIPRKPAARLHLLIVPLIHIQNVSTLTEEHRPLLGHMKKVAIEQLRVHAKHFGNDGSQLIRLAPPPSHYGFNRGDLSSLHPSTEVYKDEQTPMDSSFVFCFHVPPYNSIDHLHLHAIQKPYRTWWNKIMFAENTPWHGSLENILQNLSSLNSHL